MITATTSTPPVLPPDLTPCRDRCRPVVPARTPRYDPPTEPATAVRHRDGCPTHEHGACLCGVLGSAW